MVRLKELLSRNADARQDLRAGVTLDAIQQRHRRLRGQLAEHTPELTGTAPDEAATMAGSWRAGRCYDELLAELNTALWTGSRSNQPRSGEDIGVQCGVRGVGAGPFRGYLATRGVSGKRPDLGHVRPEFGRECSNLAKTRHALLAEFLLLRRRCHFLGKCFLDGSTW